MTRYEQIVGIAVMMRVRKSSTQVERTHELDVSLEILGDGRKNFFLKKESVLAVKHFVKNVNFLDYREEASSKTFQKLRWWKMVV